MKRKKAYSSLLGLVIFALLTTSSVSAVNLNVRETPESSISTLSDPIVFNLGSMAIDGDNDPICQVDYNHGAVYDITNYMPGTDIVLTADYEIINDNMSSWDEGPNGPGLPKSIHPNCIEKWEFSIVVEEYGTVWNKIESETVVKKDINGDPEEKLSVLAPSRVAVDSEFIVQALFHGDPTYKDWGLPEVFTFDGEEYTADVEDGCATLTAPSQTGDYLLEAEKNWNGQWGSPEDLFTYGETMTSVVDSIAADQLVVYAASSALEGETFEVFVRVDEYYPVEGATVEIDGQTYTTNIDGKAIVDTPSVDENTVFDISVSKSGYSGETAEIEILYDPDVVDDSGTSGTVTLTFSFDKLYLRDNNPMDLRFKLECEHLRWDWNNHPHWYDKHGYEKDLEELILQLSYNANDDPNIVSYDAPQNVKVGQAAEFSVKANDPDGDEIKYTLDLVIGQNVYPLDIIGYTQSGKEVTFSYTFSSMFEGLEGTIYACAHDGYGGVDCESSPIKIQKSRARNTDLNDLLSRLLNNFPLLTQLIEKLMDLR